jgi:hypothetical protein
MNTRAIENSLMAFKIGKKPAVHEIAIEIDSQESRDMVLDQFAEWIANFMPMSLGPLSAFGCVDVGGARVFCEAGISCFDDRKD